MQTIRLRSLAAPAAAVVFGVVLTLPAPATAAWMPPLTAVVFLFAMAALTIAQSVGALTRFHARRSAVAAVPSAFFWDIRRHDAAPVGDDVVSHRS